MPHIDFKNNLPGIRGALAYRPETAGPLGELAEILLRDDEGLSRADRELIAMYVSHLNDCFYCCQSHGAIASIYLGQNDQLIEDVKTDYEQAKISDKLKALLAIAGKVQQSGKAVSSADIARAVQAGASDRDIHDTVLITAVFALFNRYVDGLATITPLDKESYKERAAQVAEKGYGTHLFKKQTELSKQV
jgi:uncharacterized peroxidase-related enzyme